MEVEWIHFKEIASTHDYAVEHAEDFDTKKLTCLLADEQTAGRGRYEKRKWVSKLGNLHLTFCLETAIRPYLAQLLAFSAAEVLPCHVQIKWPNDLVVEGKKLAGTIAQGADSFAVLSIGINVNAQVQTDQPTISLKEITGKEWEVKALAEAIADRLLFWLDRGFPSHRFNELLLHRGEKIRLSNVEGTLIGVTNEGLLQLQRDDGSVQTFATGEIGGSCRE